MKPTLEIGLIGTGFMGQTHSFGYAIAEKAFDLPIRFNLNTVADVTEEAAFVSYPSANSLGRPNSVPV